LTSARTFLWSGRWKVNIFKGKKDIMRVLNQAAGEIIYWISGNWSIVAGLVGAWIFILILFLVIV